MTTREVADYLRIKQRKVYDLVKARRIPCTRVTGKWLFPRRSIDAWLAERARGETPVPAPPPIVAGSHDPLLEWCLAEAGTGLALLPGGSTDGLERLAAGAAVICGLHLRDAATGDYNVAALRESLAGLDVVAVEWAWREQGIVVAPGNPRNITGIGDLSGLRVAHRQPGAGSQVLLEQLLAEAGMAFADLDALPEPAPSETELAMAVLEGQADAGLAVASAAQRLKLDFVPLQRERYDLVMRRRDYFEPPFQALLGFARTAAFAARAAALGGYDCASLGKITYNAP